MFHHHRTYQKMTKIQNLDSKLDKAWATTAITLGAWETVALTTKKLPTISRTCQLARRKKARETELVIIAWLTGLGIHLLKRSEH